MDISEGCPSMRRSCGVYCESHLDVHYVECDEANIVLPLDPEHRYDQTVRFLDNTRTLPLPQTALTQRALTTLSVCLQTCR